MNLVNSRTGEEERTLTFQVGRMRRSRRWRARAFLSKMQRRIQVFWEERTWKWGLKTQRRKRGTDDCRRNLGTGSQRRPRLAGQILATPLLTTAGGSREGLSPFRLCPQAFPDAGPGADSEP